MFAKYWIILFGGTLPASVFSSENFFPKIFSKREAPVVAELSDALHLKKKINKKNKISVCRPDWTILKKSLKHSVWIWEVQSDKYSRIPQKGLEDFYELCLVLWKDGVQRILDLRLWCFIKPEHKSIRQGVRQLMGDLSPVNTPRNWHDSSKDMLLKIVIKRRERKILDCQYACQRRTELIHIIMSYFQFG